ncbi:MAG TPA: PKD domain-containing protein [Actinocrinis sp.]|uniref:PKD domain-containing protein n=1 Tax=Actinocrinis sp. TaxID=1920516 RepID=UPI002DDD79AD|nr:PKD domain-containing protein [Actinocrinis sp.]HEV2346148.1 PKD domain-containing protein [Actinocrinis sp.]
MARPPHPDSPPRHLRRTRLAAVGGLCAALLGFSALPPASAATAASAPNTVRTLTATADDTAALAQAYAMGRRIPHSAVGELRADSEHFADDDATGTEWAVAGFLPSAAAGTQLTIDLQDGAGRGLFEKAKGGDWTLIPTPTVAACASNVPAAVKAALGLAGSAVDCSTALPSAAAKAAAAKAAKAGSTSLGANIANVALTQTGHATTPAETSFNGVDCDPYTTLVAAFSPNADGCGPDAGYNVQNQNEEWCSDFAKWTWEQGGVTQDMNTIDAAASSYYTWALNDGQTPAADSGTPQPGDAVLFYSPGTITASKFANHVGIITSVNADGTVNMANGDFLGSDGITVEYNQNLNLTPWAASVWGAGEQWVLVAPPTAAQQPNPTATITAAATAVAGTSVGLAATATESNGSISKYYWTFDDGRNNNITAQTATHVFPRAGLYTVTMTATSNFGTIITKTWNIGVSAPSSAVASAPNNAVWYTVDPLMQYSFTPGSGSSLAVDSWDGGSWLQQTEPGQLAAGTAITGLSYADPDAGYATIPHAYFRSTGGALGETYIGANGWTSAALPGTPAAQSALAALAADPVSGGSPASHVTPTVFFFDASGALNATTETGGSWSTAALPAPATATPGSLATAVSGNPLAVEYAFYLDGSDRLTAVANTGGAWMSTTVSNSLGVQPGSRVSAATTDSGVDVFFTDAAGRLAVASSSVTGGFTVSEVPGAVAAGGSLTATNVLSSADAVQDEVFYPTASGAVGVTEWNGSAWQASTLPGTATAITGVSSNIVPGQSEQVFTANGAKLNVDSATAPGAAWTATALPNTPTTYPGTVLLYAATSADDTSALAAAKFAGLPASQVTRNFTVAWGATLSGNHLVIAVGAAAVNALYDNPCGWANPSQQDPGSTPFGNVERPLNVTLTNLFLVGEAATASKTPQVANDMAYYAVHGALPSGTTLPKLAYPGSTCLGTPS